MTTSLSSSGPVGFVVSSDLKWVVRVDLAAMLAAGASSDASTELETTAMAIG